MFAARPEIVATRLNSPLVVAPPVAATVVAFGGKTPFTTEAAGGANCTTCAVSADEYHVTRRSLSVPPTPSTTSLIDAEPPSSATGTRDVKSR